VPERRPGLPVDRKDGGNPARMPSRLIFRGSGDCPPGPLRERGLGAGPALADAGGMRAGPVIAAGSSDKHCLGEEVSCVHSRRCSEYRKHAGCLTRE